MGVRARGACPCTVIQSKIQRISQKKIKGVNYRLSSYSYQMAEFDQTDPRSIFNLLPQFLQQAASQVADDIWELSEDELSKQLEVSGEVPTEYYRLRIAFWDEYDRVQRMLESKLDVSRVTWGVCSVVTLMKWSRSNHLLLAWLLRPPPAYTLLLKEIHSLSLKNQLEVMKMPLTNERGNPNVKLIEAQLKIFQHMDIRLKGGFIQRIEQKNLNVNVDGESLPTGNNKSLSLQEMEVEIKKLREQSKLLEIPMHATFDPQKLITGEILNKDVSQAATSSLVKDVSPSTTPTEPEENGDEL